MAASPYPLPRETRQSNQLVGNGTAGPYGPTTYKVFDTADIEVWAKPAGAQYFSKASGFTATKTVDAQFATVTVTFTTAIPSTTVFRIIGRRTHERSVSVLKSGAIDSNALEQELSKQGTILQEVRRDLDNTIRLPPGGAGINAAPLAPGHFWMADIAGNLVDGGLTPVWTDVSVPARPVKLTTDTTFYVNINATGDDGPTRTGLTDDPDVAFEHLSQLYAFLVKNVDANGFAIHIRGTGDYSGSNSENVNIAGRIMGVIAPSQVTIEAKGGVATSFRLKPSSGAAAIVSQSAMCRFDKMTLGSPAGAGIQALTYAQVNTGPGIRVEEWLAVTGQMFYATRFAYFEAEMGFTVAGGGGNLFAVAHTGNFRVRTFLDRVTTFVGNPTITALNFLDYGDLTYTGDSNFPSANPSNWSGTVNGGIFYNNRGGFFQWATGFPGFDVPSGMSADGVNVNGGITTDGIGIGADYLYKTGTGAGPTRFLQRKGNADAALLAQEAFYGDNSAGDDKIFALIRAAILDWTAGSEDGSLTFQTMINAVLTTQMAMANGVILGNPTGGFKGTGTLNAVGVYDDNVLLTDLVLDMAAAGAFDAAAYAGHPIAAELAPWWFDIDAYADAWRRERRLPGMLSWADPADRPATGEMVTRLVAVCETFAAHIDQLNRRVKELEARDGVQ